MIIANVKLLIGEKKRGAGADRCAGGRGKYEGVAL